MALSINKRVISSKINILAEQRNHLQNLVHEADEVLQLATSWMKNSDETKNVTFKDINHRIEDKLVFLSDKCTDFSVDCEKTTDEQESATRDLSAVSTPTDQPSPARYDHVSGIPDEIKTVMNQVLVMQGTISFLSTSIEKISEKQLIMEQCIQSMSDKYSKGKEEQVRETEIEPKQLEKPTQDLNAIAENIQYLNSRICLLENRAYSEIQKSELDENSENLGQRFRKHCLPVEGFSKRTDESPSSLEGIGCERLQELEDKMSAIEMNWSETSQEARKLYHDVETKYQMVCQLVANRLAPLEKLKDIFNVKMDARQENMRRLDNVCGQVTNLLPKVAQLEAEQLRQALAVSAHMPFGAATGAVISSITDIFSNIGNQSNARP